MEYAFQFLSPLLCLLNFFHTKKILCKMNCSNNNDVLYILLIILVNENKMNVGLWRNG